MPEKTEAQKRAQKNYMDKFAVARVRIEKDRYEDIQTAAATVGESVNGYINKAITQRMGQDSGGTPPTGLQEDIEGAGVVSLPPKTLKTAQEAAQASGETLSQFISWAVETQAQNDARVHLSEDRLKQTTAALVWEIEDTARLVTSTLWCNVAYNGKLYKKPKDAQEVHNALEECKRGINAMLDNLIEKVVLAHK